MASQCCRAEAKFTVTVRIVRPDSRTGHPGSGQIERALFIAESYGGCDGDGVAGGQQAGEECTDAEERGGCEQTGCGKRVLHPVGENGTEKAVHGKTYDNACGRADERDARGDPQNVLARRAERQANAELRSALSNAVSDDAEDANQRERKRHGREDAKQYGEEPLAAVLCVARDGFIECKSAVETAVGERLAGSDGRDSGTDGLQISERIALGADKELRVGPHQSSVWKVDGGGDGVIEAVIARIADHADDLTPGGALRRGDLVLIPSYETGNA